jgi:AcrR family transcriptional regulator
MKTSVSERRPGARAAKDPSTRAQIVAAARRHFMAHGFRGVTMDDLAAELGMSKKTFYAHFESKQALVEAVLQEKLAQANADFGRIVSGDQDFPDMIHELLACVQRHAGEIQPSFVRDMSRETPEMFKMVEVRRQEMIQRHFGTIFAKGRKLGAIRKDIPIELITEILVGATRAVANPAKVQEMNQTPKSVLSAIITIVLEGALTEKGRGET